LHFRAAVRLNPQDANAEANLGSALAETGNLREARLHFERALQIDPKNELARENLEQLNRELPSQPK
jgi:Flp pilus assembly protein TadD